MVVGDRLVEDRLVGDRLVGDSLVVNNVSKYYKNFLALENIDLHVKKGEFLTILGPSGSGKTTLLKMIAGFENVTKGEILLNSQDISKKKAFERGFGMMFQNYALFPHMTVYENIAYPLKLRKKSKKDIEVKVKEILHLVKLQDYSQRYPSQLSGGQQQRVALARAIVFNPPVLLLDEPLGALDKNLRQQMQFEIKTIQKEVGITTISVTHDQEEALTMSDRICIMDHGCIKQVDSPENIYNKPQNSFVAKFMGEINLLEGLIVKTEADFAKVKISEELMIDASAENVALLKEDTKVFVAIRPENLRIAQDTSQFKNTIQVKVTEAIYIGEALKVKAQTSNGQEILVKIPYSEAGPIVMGNEIRLGCNSKDALLIPFN